MKKTLLILALTLLVSPILLAADRPLDSAHSKITIHVGKAGLFATAYLLVGAGALGA